jgi:Zn-dependent protease
MDFLNGSFRVARIFDINVRVHVLFLIFIVFQLFQARDWQTELTFLTLLFGIVLLHEFGHCFGARLVGGYADNILMWPLGGLAYAHAPIRPWPQFVTVAAGPLVNVILCAISAAVLLVATEGRVRFNLLPIARGIDAMAPGPVWLDYVAVFYEVNFFLLGFNLLPIYPMDGGQLLHTILWPFFGLQRSTILACQIGLVGAALLGYWGLQREGMLLWIAIFGGFVCWQQMRAAQAGLLVEDSRDRTYGPSHDPRPWWKRMLGLRQRPRESAPFNPNPGGWTERVNEREREEQELDRILKKVSQYGIQSLSYVERQRLERISRDRQEQDRAFDRSGRG